MFKIKAVEEKDNLGKFEIEPLEEGMGHTVGNSLRRVLLSNLNGGAITWVKIDGAPHQFSTIDGVVEDVIEIILNIKKVRVRLGGSSVKLSLKASGKKEVKAKDLEILGDGEIVNPDQHIATLTTSSAKFNLELVAEKGKGYSKAEERKTNEIGMMAVDAIYSPVMEVNYGVEPTRVGRQANFDRLVIAITTDGTISPLEALNEAARYLQSTFLQIVEPSVIEESEKVGDKAISDDTLNLTVEELDLPVRITNALKAIDVDTVGQLMTVSRIQLMKAKNLGSKSLGLISEKLQERGLSLSEA